MRVIDFKFNNKAAVTVTVNADNITVHIEEPDVVNNTCKTPTETEQNNTGTANEISQIDWKKVKEFVEENELTVELPEIKNKTIFVSENQIKDYLLNYPFNTQIQNCIILNPEMAADFSGIIQDLKSFINPEERIIKICLEKGSTLYSIKDYKQANKYFSKIMVLSKEDSSEYRFAKSRLVNV